MFRTTIFVVVALCIALAPAAASDVVGVSSEVEAFTKARHDLQLGFSVPGKVRLAHVKVGERVVKGQPLLELDDEEGAALVELWRMKAETDVAIHQAEAALEMADFEVEKREYLEREDTGAPLELKRARIQQKIQRLALEAAILDQKQANLELARYEALHSRYIMNAPLDGTVEELTVSEGETVEQFKPVLLLVVTDPLWVDAWVPTQETLKFGIGDPAWVHFKLSGYEKPMKGEIIHMGAVADAASGMRLVRVELPNTMGLPAGVQVKVEFGASKDLAKADAVSDASKVSEASAASAGGSAAAR